MGSYASMERIWCIEQISINLVEYPRCARSQSAHKPAAEVNVAHGKSSPTSRA